MKSEHGWMNNEWVNEWPCISLNPFKWIMNKDWNAVLHFI